MHRAPPEPPPPGPLDTVRDLVTAAPDFALAATFLVTWIAPYTFGRFTVKRLLLVMLLEFLVVHSAGMMAGITTFGWKNRMKTAGAMIGLGLFYSLFAGAFSAAFATWWPLAAFWALMANRLLGVILGAPPTGREKAYIMSSWAFGAAAYLLGVFATIIPPLPRLGVTQGVVSSQELSGSGVWIDEPHRVLAFGVVYFTLVGLWELRGRRAVGAAEM